MIVDVVAVTVLEGHRLLLKFDDGVEGEFDFGRAVGFEGVFAPLQDADYFAQARVEPDIGTVVWPNGADLDPIVLHATVTGHTVQVA
jgi:hypothetical protein